jgi:hypothetical protein
MAPFSSFSADEGLHRVFLAPGHGVEGALTWSWSPSCWYSPHMTSCTSTSAASWRAQAVEVIAPHVVLAGGAVHVALAHAHVGVEVDAVAKAFGHPLAETGPGAVGRLHLRDHDPEARPVLRLHRLGRDEGGKGQKGQGEVVTRVSLRRRCMVLLSCRLTRQVDTSTMLPADHVRDGRGASPFNLRKVSGRRRRDSVDPLNNLAEAPCATPLPLHPYFSTAIHPKGSRRRGSSSPACASRRWRSSSDTAAVRFVS